MDNYLPISKIGSYFETILYILPSLIIKDGTASYLPISKIGSYFETAIFLYGIAGSSLSKFTYL